MSESTEPSEPPAAAKPEGSEAASSPPPSTQSGADTAGLGEAQIAGGNGTKLWSICGICGKAVAKYRCPQCPIAYCSVACFRPHRENHPPIEDRKPTTPAPIPAAADSKAAKAEFKHPFSVLDDSIELKRLFAKYPNLPSRLKRIYDATLRPKDDGATRGGLPWKVSSGSFGSKKDTWTPDVGLRRGQTALRHARTDPGEEGDGVREYCEVVTYLLSKPEHGNATAIVRQEVKDLNAHVIQQLMELERHQS